MNSPPQYVVLKNAQGIEVSRHRTDCMNFAGFTQVFSLEEERHGKLTWELIPIPEYSTGVRNETR